MTKRPTWFARILDKIADSITSRAVLKLDGPARAAMLEIAEAIREGGKP